MNIYYANGWAPNKGRKFSPEWRSNMSNSHKGLKKSPETIAKIVEKTTGLKRTEEAKLKISKSKIGKKWKEKLYTYNNGSCEKRIPESRIKEFEDKGWKRGRGNKCRQTLHKQKGTKCYINKNGKNKVIDKCEISNYLDEGYSLGKAKNDIKN